VSKAAVSNRGVTEITLPGVILVTWNAVHTKNGTHHAAACRAAQQIMEEFQNEPLLKDNFEVSMAVSSGSMRCGAVGTTHTRKFVVIGNAINDCLKLMWLAENLDGVKILIDQTVRDEASFEFRFSIVDRVQTRKGGPRMVLSELRERLSTGANEWMYELRDAKVTDEHRVYNTAFEAFLDGNIDVAQENIKTLGDRFKGTVLQKLIESESMSGGVKYCRVLFGP